MLPNLTEYHRPTTMSGALRLLARRKVRTVPLAGGTALVPSRDTSVEAVVDLSGLNLAGIEWRALQAHIGAMTTLRALASDAAARGCANGLLVEAARVCVTRNLRNVATVGGTLVAGGTACDLLVALLALDARVTVRVRRVRTLALEDFLTAPYEYLDGGIITHLAFPFLKIPHGAALARIARTPKDAAIVNAGALVVPDGGTCKQVRLEYTRDEEFIAARSRHPQILRFKTGVRRDGTITAMTLKLLATTGAYGSHALTVQGNTGSKALALYRCPNLRFEMDVVYTNRPHAGAMRGYGAPQGLFALEVHMDEIAVALGMDPIEFRRRNWVQVGDVFALAEALGEGRKGFPNPLRSTGLAECVERGAQLIGWERRRDPSWRSVPDIPHVRRGIGMAALIHGSGIPGM